MVRIGILVVGLSGLLGLAGCDQPYRGYGNNHRPSYGGSYHRSYDRGYDNRNRDDRNRDSRSYQNSRGNPGSSGNRGGGGSNRNNDGIITVPRTSPDPPANHQGN